MSMAIRVGKAGGPEVLEWVDVAVGEPGAGEALVRHTAIGLNFVDVYFRSGLYPPPQGYPFTPGSEGAGVVEAIGPGVAGLMPGDRVVYQTNLGAYAERRLIKADLLVKVPDAVEDRTAAAGFLKGLTAYCLLHETWKVGPGTTLLFHAAAGGVGSLACQWARTLGATVIGTVGSAAKVEAAKANGCHHVIDMGTENFVARVKEITGGAGVDVVYDSIGKNAFPGNLDCIRPRGLWCAFGQSSGPSPEFQIGLLQQKGALFATRMTVFVYLAKRRALDAAAATLFKAFADGTVKIAARQEFALKDAAKAQAALEGRRTSGQTLLIP